MTTRENADRKMLAAAARQKGRSFSEQFTPSKDDLRDMLAEAVRNTATLQTKETTSAE